MNFTFGAVDINVTQEEKQAMLEGKMQGIAASFPPNTTKADQELMNQMDQILLQQDRDLED